MPEDAAAGNAELVFPPEFLWGVGTAAYQIEGAVDADGRAPSVWDEFCARPGAIRDGDTGEVACDSYHLFGEDVGLVGALGAGAYRFSIAWPRVQPRPDGPPSPRGLAYYDRVVDALLAAGVEPFVTLFHWDTPSWVHERGGWPARDTVDRFVTYAAMVHDAVGDRVQWWGTLNEPWCVAYLGHLAGVHAPGIRDPAAAVASAHHQLLAHGRAARLLRERGARVGLALNPAPIRADADDPVDADVVRRVDGLLNRWFLDGLVGGRYPVDVLEDLGPLAVAVRPGDGAEIAAPLDWLGINYYHDHVIRPANEPDPYLPYPRAPAFRPQDPGPDATDLGWPLTPHGLTDLLVRLSTDYPALPPLVVTENGAAFDDPVVDGAYRDERRIAYLDAHLRAVHAAIAQGVSVTGYFCWTLLDNFEWAHGYAMRFGLVHVDRATLARTPRASFDWFAQRCRTGRLPRVPRGGES